MLCENLYMPANLLIDTGHADTCQADFLLNLAAFQPTLWQLPKQQLWTKDLGLPRKQLRQCKNRGEHPHSHFLKKICFSSEETVKYLSFQLKVFSENSGIIAQQGISFTSHSYYKE